MVQRDRDQHNHDLAQAVREAIESPQGRAFFDSIRTAAKLFVGDTLRRENRLEMLAAENILTRFVAHMIAFRYQGRCDESFINQLVVAQGRAFHSALANLSDTHQSSVIIDGDNIIFDSDKA